MKEQPHFTESDRKNIEKIVSESSREQLEIAVSAFIEQTITVVVKNRALMQEIMELRRALKAENKDEMAEIIERLTKEIEKERTTSQALKDKVSEQRLKYEDEEAKETVKDRRIEELQNDISVLKGRNTLYTTRLKKKDQLINELSRDLQTSRREHKPVAAQKKPTVKISLGEDAFAAFGAGSMVAIFGFFIIGSCVGTPVVESYCEDNNIEGSFFDTKRVPLNAKDFDYKAYFVSVVERSGNEVTTLAQFHKYECKFDDSYLPKLLASFDPQVGSNRYVLVHEVDNSKKSRGIYLQFDTETEMPRKELGTTGVKGDQIVMFSKRYPIASQRIERDNSMNRGFLEFAAYASKKSEKLRVGLDSKTQRRDDVEKNSMPVKEYVEVRKDEILDAKEKHKIKVRAIKKKKKKQEKERKKQARLNYLKDLLGMK